MNKPTLDELREDLLAGRDSRQGLLTQIRTGIELGKIKLHLTADWQTECEVARERELDVHASTPSGAVPFATHVFWISITGEIHVTGDIANSLPGDRVPFLKAHIILDEDGDYSEVVYTDGNNNPYVGDFHSEILAAWYMLTDDIQPQHPVDLTRAAFKALGINHNLDLLKVNAVSLGREYVRAEYIESKCRE